MKDVIKEMFLMGIGAATLTRKKAEQTVKVFVKKGLINQKQAKEIIARMMTEADKVRKRLRKEGMKEIRRVERKILKAGRDTQRKVSSRIDSISRSIARRAIKK